MTTTTRLCPDGPLFLAALLAVLAACTSAPPVALELPPAPAWTPITPTHAGAGLEVSARVLAGPGATTVISVPLRASVTLVRARAGDAVAAGDPLVDVVMPEVLEAAGRLEGARLRLETWTRRFQQLDALRAEGLARSLDVSEAAIRIAEAKADSQAARAVLLSAGVEDGDAASRVAGKGAVTLKAPVAGLVTRVTVTVGERREPSAGPVVELASVQPTRVEARFPHAPDVDHYQWVSQGSLVPLTLLSRAPNADPRDGAFLAWFEPQGGVSLVAGSLGRVVQAAHAPAAFQVPALAIHRVEGSAHVETRRGDIPIEVMRCEVDACVVRGALKVGDEVLHTRDQG